MADKTIGELPGISYLDAGSLFVAEQSGQAVKVSGKQLTDFSNVETTAQVEQAKASAQEAKTAQAAAEAAILKGPIIQNGTWCVYNQTAGAYQDTGIKATGPQGIPGPTSSVNGISPDASGNITLTASNMNAYSKTETDTLLAGKAPAGYGYGEAQAIAFWDDDDGTKLEQGLDSKFAPSSMRGKVFRTMLVDYPICKVSGNGGFADIFADESNDSNGYSNSIMIVLYARHMGTTGPSIATKQKIGGTWYPWEYVNPPMQFGVEYRTTERWYGSPVYAQLFDCSPLPNATTKVFPVEGNYADEVVNIVVDYGGMSSYFGQSLQNKGFANINVTQSKIYITTESDLSAGNAYVWVKYTKW